jgi:hypothetical protein
LVITPSSTTGATYGAGTKIIKHQLKSSENWWLVCFPKSLKKQWNENVFIILKCQIKYGSFWVIQTPLKKDGTYLLLKSIYKYHFILVVLTVKIIYLCRTNSPVVTIMVVGIWNLLVSDKDVDIKFSAHSASCTLKIRRLEIQIFWGRNKVKGPKQDGQNRLRSHMPEGGEP